MTRFAAAALAVLVLLVPRNGHGQIVPPGGPPAAPRDVPKGDAAAGGVIRGRVTSLETGKPLRRARITLASPVLGTPRTASTNTDGRYEIRDLPAARYTLNVSRSGYLPLAYGQRRPGEPGKPFELAEQQVAEKVDFALPRRA